MTRTRVAIVGLNHYHVTGWVESLAALRERIDVVARYDVDSTRSDGRPPDHVDPHLAPHFPGTFANVPFESDLDELIATHRPDLAVVTLPNIDAPAAIETLANAGVHILVDKPAARNASEAASAFAAVDAAGVKAAVAFTRRYGKGWQDVAALIGSGKLGRLIATEAFFVTSSVAVRDPANPIFRKHEMGGGVLHWLGIHDIDLLLWLTGERIVEVQAMSATIHPGIDVEDVMSASVRYESGAIGTLHYVYALPRTGGEGHVAIRGTNGSVRILPDGSWTWTGPGTLLDPMMSQTTTYESRSSSGYGAVGAVIVDDLLRAIEEDRDPLATGAHAVAALRMIDAIYAAANTGTRIHLGLSP